MFNTVKKTYMTESIDYKIVSVPLSLTHTHLSSSSSTLMRAMIGLGWHICQWGCGYRSHDSTGAPPMFLQRSSPVNLLEVPGGLNTTQKCYCLTNWMMKWFISQCCMIQMLRWFPVSTEHISAQIADHYTNRRRNSCTIHTGWKLLHLDCDR